MKISIGVRNFPRTARPIPYPVRRGPRLLGLRGKTRGGVRLRGATLEFLGKKCLKLATGFQMFSMPRFGSTEVKTCPRQLARIEELQKTSLLWRANWDGIAN